MPLALARKTCDSAGTSSRGQKLAPTNVTPRNGQPQHTPVTQLARRVGARANSTTTAVERRAGTHLDETKFNARQHPPPVPVGLVRLAGAQPWTGHGADRGQQPRHHGPCAWLAFSLGRVKLARPWEHGFGHVYTGLLHPLADGRCCRQRRYRVTTRALRCLWHEVCVDERTNR